MANTKKSPAKKTVAKKSEIKKLADKEITNGAFILILVLCVVIGGVLGWLLGGYAFNLLN
ncbi:MAG: hypothetical protein II119_00890 [Bacilli bacterium]|nr:hypothetical protein [Bacilli bacterium]MBQ6282755.1 hypothetical protein [Bacilli bacterium]